MTTDSKMKGFSLTGLVAAGAIAASSLIILVAVAGAIARKPSTPEQPAESEAVEVQSQPSPASNTFTIEYQETGVYPQLKTLLQRSQVLEYGADSLSKTYKLNPVTVSVKECNDRNAYYLPGKSGVLGMLGDGEAIVICYELIADYLEKFRAKGLTQQQAMRYALYAAIFSLLHESGHLIIHQFSIPYTGSEEDAADEFAVVEASKMDGGDRIIKAAILYYGLVENKGFAQNFHRADRQRMFFLSCLLYGSNPKQQELLAKQLQWPSERMGQCQGNYDRASTSWNHFLKEHKK